ncbi:MAG TPA: acylphosphatase [Nocardioidaceae bacterium]|nr:acylphosphatase [Nocardioidaceae bacterium]
MPSPNEDASDGVQRIARRVVARGHVQGVFYRDTCQREAEFRGVTGWVRNRTDGAVEALFEGPEGAVGQLVDWARSGPRRAVVDSSEVDEVEPSGLTRFEVRG